MKDFNFFNERPLKAYKKSDPVLIVLVILLTGMGLVTLFFASADRSADHLSDSTAYVTKQLFAVGVGVLALMFFSVVRIEFLRKILPIVSIIAVILCVSTYFIGDNYGTTARRWILIPVVNVSFQPSELIKFVMVLFLANQFDRHDNVIAAVFGLVIFVAIVMVGDFSTGFFIMIAGLLMFFVSGAKLLWLLPCSAILIPLSALIVFQNPARVERIINFLSPNQNLLEGNYQTRRAIAAIVSGGWFGQGMGTGLIKSEFVPEIASDYIFAGWIEATGFVGLIIFLALIIALSVRIFYHAFTCSDRFTSYVCFGFGTLIAAQSLLNISIVAGILPSTGLPLPFFSAGGTSIVITLAMCGFVINASRIEKIENEVKIEDVIYE